MKFKKKRAKIDKNSSLAKIVLFWAMRKLNLPQSTLELIIEICVWLQIDSITAK